eukprot:EG_transcript_42164
MDGVVCCGVLYCVALHCIALHCIALHCIALHCTGLWAWYCTGLLHWNVLYCTALCCIVLYCILSCAATCVFIALFCIALAKSSLRRTGTEKASGGLTPFLGGGKWRRHKITRSVL